MWRKWLLNLFRSPGGKNIIKNLPTSSGKTGGRQLDLFNEYPYSPPGSLDLGDGRQKAIEWLKNNKSQNLKGTKYDFEEAWKKFIQEKGFLGKKLSGGEGSHTFGIGSQSPRRKEVQGSIYPGMKKGGSLKRVNGLWVRK